MVSVLIHGLEAGQLYEVESETADKSILCAIETSGPIELGCDEDLFSHVEHGTPRIGLIHLLRRWKR